MSYIKPKFEPAVKGIGSYPFLSFEVIAHDDSAYEIGFLDVMTIRNGPGNLKRHLPNCTLRFAKSSMDNNISQLIIKAPFVDALWAFWPSAYAQIHSGTGNIGQHYANGEWQKVVERALKIEQYCANLFEGSPNPSPQNPSRLPLERGALSWRRKYSSEPAGHTLP